MNFFKSDLLLFFEKNPANNYTNNVYGLYPDELVFSNFIWNEEYMYMRQNMSCCLGLRQAVLYGDITDKIMAVRTSVLSKH